jgi:hypothetical protein
MLAMRLVSGVILASFLGFPAPADSAGSPLVSALGVQQVGSDKGSPFLRFPGGRAPIRVNISAPASDGDYLAAAFAYGTGSYYISDTASHIYQVSEETGQIGTITTFSAAGVYSIQCLCFDESSGFLVALARSGIFVLDPSKSAPIKKLEVYTYGVSYCRVDDATGDVYYLQSASPNTVFVANVRSGKSHKIEKVSPRPLSVNPFVGGVLFLSDNAPSRQWGGVSTLNLLDPKTGKTTLSFNYSFPEGGSPPKHCANAVVPLDATDPSHVTFVSILDDNENGFICDAFTDFQDGKFRSGGGKFAVFGDRPGQFKVLDIHASN